MDLLNLDYESYLTVSKLKEIIKDLPDDMPVGTAYRGTGHPQRFGRVRNMTLVNSLPLEGRIYSDGRPGELFFYDEDADCRVFKLYKEKLLLLND